MVRSPPTPPVLHGNRLQRTPAGRPIDIPGSTSGLYAFSKHQRDVESIGDMRSNLPSLSSWESASMSPYRTSYLNLWAICNVNTSERCGSIICTKISHLPDSLVAHVSTNSKHDWLESLPFINHFFSKQSFRNKLLDHSTGYKHEIFLIMFAL